MEGWRRKERLLSQHLREMNEKNREISAITNYIVRMCSYQTTKVCKVQTVYFFR
jgi:hypothetical protein